MTKEFLESIGLPTLEEYEAENAEFGKATESFYREVLNRTQTTTDGMLESFISVFKDSTALTLVGNLIKWAASVLPGIRETIEARAECREALK
jgi:hypothetical protein